MQHHMMVDIGIAKMYLVRCCLCLYSEMHLNLMYSLVILKTHFFYLLASIFFFRQIHVSFISISIFLQIAMKMKNVRTLRLIGKEEKYLSQNKSF